MNKVFFLLIIASQIFIGGSSLIAMEKVVEKSPSYAKIFKNNRLECFGPSIEEDQLKNLTSIINSICDCNDHIKDYKGKPFVSFLFSLSNLLSLLIDLKSSTITTIKKAQNFEKLNVIVESFKKLHNSVNRHKKYADPPVTNSLKLLIAICKKDHEDIEKVKGDGKKHLCFLKSCAEISAILSLKDSFEVYKKNPSCFGSDCENKSPKTLNGFCERCIEYARIEFFKLDSWSKNLKNIESVLREFNNELYEKVASRKFHLYCHGPELTNPDLNESFDEIGNLLESEKDKKTGILDDLCSIL